mgnify:CR=1 FL=1
MIWRGLRPIFFVASIRSVFAFLLLLAGLRKIEGLESCVNLEKWGCRFLLSSLLYSTSAFSLNPKFVLLLLLVVVVVSFIFGVCNLFSFLLAWR